MNVLDYFSSNPQFDPSNPGGFDYMQAARRLQQQQASAAQFGNVQAFGGMGKGATLAYALQKALGGVMAGRAQRDELALDSAAKEQFDFYRNTLNNSKSRQELEAEAQTFYKDPEVAYTYKPGVEVGPTMDDLRAPAAPMAAPAPAAAPTRPPKFAGKSYDPAARVGTERGRGTNTSISGDGVEDVLQQRDAAQAELKNVKTQLSTYGGVQRQRDPGGFAELQRRAGELESSIFALENKVAPAYQNRPLSKPVAVAPAAPVAAAPVAAPTPAARSAMAQAPAAPMAAPAPMTPQSTTPRSYALEDSFNMGMDPAEVRSTVQSRSAYVRDAAMRQEAERATALQALETNPRAQSFLKQMAARQAAQASMAADRDKFMFEQDYKAQAEQRGSANKIVGTPQTAADGRQYVVNGKGEIQYLSDGGKPVMDAGFVEKRAERAAGRSRAQIALKRSTSEIDSFIAAGLAKDATGVPARFKAFINAKTGYVTDASKARAELEGMFSGAISNLLATLEAAGIKGNTLVDTKAGAETFGRSLLNINFDTMDAKQIESQLMKYRNHISDLAETAIERTYGVDAQPTAPAARGGNVGPKGIDWSK